MKEELVVTFRMNGVSNAFLREVGCKCDQCSLSKPRVSTSGSLLIKRHTKAELTTDHHVLFDFGPGVADSLIDSNIDNVNFFFNSHNHLDHIADLDRILNSLRRHKSGVKTWPLYSTTGTWVRGIYKSYPWLTGEYGMINFKDLYKDGRLNSVELDLGIELKVTPVPVYHGPYAHEPVIFVIEFKVQGNWKKLVLCWDLLHLVSRHPEFDYYDPKVDPNSKTSPGSSGYPTDDYPPLFKDREEIYQNIPNLMADLSAHEVSKAHEILLDSDDLFLSGNTITPQYNTGHASITSGLHLIRRLRPKRSWIVHYSGHEDKFGSLTDRQLQEWIAGEKKGADYELNGAEIRVAEHRLVINYNA